MQRPHDPSHPVRFDLAHGLVGGLGAELIEEREVNPRNGQDDEQEIVMVPVW